MTDEEITSALDASGDCGACNGRGSVVDDQRWVPCDRCGGSGVDQRTVLRAVQAVGKLLRRAEGGR